MLQDIKDLDEIELSYWNIVSQAWDELEGGRPEPSLTILRQLRDALAPTETFAISLAGQNGRFHKFYCDLDSSKVEFWRENYAIYI